MMIRKANKEDAEKIANNNLLLAFESENISIEYIWFLKKIIK